MAGRREDERESRSAGPHAARLRRRVDRVRSARPVAVAPAPEPADQAVQDALFGPPAPIRSTAPTAEHARLAQAGGTGGEWRAFGPWLAERVWGTVREDYSADGDAWAWLTHDEARSTAYRWSEDGIAGICDAEQLTCFAFAFWNGRDPVLKERLFGLSNAEGNHGEDVKEEYAYLDATPTASWLSYAYRYPQREFPYADLLAENARRGRGDAEYELADTGALDGCWDIRIDFAKAAPRDIVVRLRATNTGADEATLHVLPTLWCRNTWSWSESARTPRITWEAASQSVVLDHHTLGRLRLTADDRAAVPLFCDNVTNTRMRYADAEGPDHPKDGIGDHVVHGAATVNPDRVGTKAALWSQLVVPAGETKELRLRVHGGSRGGPDDFGAWFDAVMRARSNEADDFHASLLPEGTSAAHAQVVRQAIAGLVWSQVFYHYDVARWLDGDPGQPPPPSERLHARNSQWRHLNAREVILMPDAWEYPWFASWDLAFHTVALAHADPWFASEQLLLLTREWYMKPSGAVPAYEWDFGDANPPVQAWAALRIARLLPPDDAHSFLERVFHKQLLYFTWWVNRVDADGNNVFEGGFLGMDNVGPFDRSHQPPGLGRLEQSDGTAWTAMLCLDLLEIALWLAMRDRAYEDVATKFFEHFAYVASAMEDLWDDEDGFCYDLLLRPDGSRVPMKVRSVAGLVALAAVRPVSKATLDALPAFTSRLEWFVNHQPALGKNARALPDGSRLLSVLGPDRLQRVLVRVLDEGEFLSPHGLRSLSAWHREHPFAVPVPGTAFPPVDYEPGESRSGIFGGNSNWRGPVWFPLNLLVITGLHRYAAALGPAYQVEHPTGSGQHRELDAVAADLAQRLCSLLEPGPDGKVPAAGDRPWPEGWTLFHEYFHGDTGVGLGASHQTGWTASVVDLLLRR
ncbi:MAG TPA: glucosidase [Mycobacteriales bacterium]|nr:glucosidase [Mycobacteriales bacterium]